MSIIYFVLCFCRYDLVEEDGSDLQTYVDKGDSRNARLHAQMVADRLNRLSQNQLEEPEEAKEEGKDLRQKIRRAHAVDPERPAHERSGKHWCSDAA